MGRNLTLHSVWWMSLINKEQKRNLSEMSSFFFSVLEDGRKHIEKDS